MKLDEAARRIPDLIEKLIQLPVEEVEYGVSGGTTEPTRCTHDLVVEADEKVFLVEFKNHSVAESVGGAIRQLRRCAEGHDESGVIPLVVVPYMGRVGQRLCEEAGIAWMDLSGNAWIHAPGLHVTVQGRPNRFSRRGRPRNVFAPKASRISRLLLLDPSSPRSQQELTEAAGLDKGYVSRVVRRLEEGGLVARGDDGRVVAADPDLLLDTWSESYDFSDHRVHRGHIAVRGSERRLRSLNDALGDAGVEHAATGLAAAWHYVSYAAYRLVTTYVAEMPDSEHLNQIGFRPVETGANVWLVVPNDAGVFAGTVEREGIPYVSAVQAYLDLLHHPERAGEAADELRRTCLCWSDHGRRQA